MGELAMFAMVGDTGAAAAMTGTIFRAGAGEVVLLSYCLGAMRAFHIIILLDS